MFNFRQKTNSITTFADLKPGDIFREPNSSANFYYIKTCATGTATNILKNDFNTTFADIGYGETFTTDSLNFNGYYMKVCAKNVSAINLLTGRSCDFESYQPIKTVQIFYED